MASNEATQLSDVERHTFALARHHYLRVTSQGQTRLTVSTFLTGLTFAAFAALLGAGSAPTQGATFDQVLLADLLAASGVLMSVATLLFLLTAASTYAALLLLANVAPYTAKALNDDKLTHLNPGDVENLQKAYDVYMRTSHWVPWGLSW